MRPNTTKDAVDDTIHCVFYLCIGIGTRKIQSQYAGGILLQPVQKLVATIMFARPPQGQKCKRVPSGVPKKKRGLLALSYFFALRAGGTRKGGTSAHTGAKIESWRAIFSPWESPSNTRRIHCGCGLDLNCSEISNGISYNRAPSRAILKAPPSATTG